MTQGEIIQYNRGWRGGIGRVIKTHVGGMEGQAATQHISTPCQHHKTTLTHHPTPLKLLTLLTNNTHGHASTQTLLRTYQTPHEREILTGYLGSSYRAFPGFFSTYLSRVTGSTLTFPTLTDPPEGAQGLLHVGNVVNPCLITKQKANIPRAQTPDMAHPSTPDKGLVPGCLHPPAATRGYYVKISSSVNLIFSFCGRGGDTTTRRLCAGAVNWKPGNLLLRRTNQF